MKYLIFTLLLSTNVFATGKVGLRIIKKTDLVKYRKCMRKKLANYRDVFNRNPDSIDLQMMSRMCKGEQ